MDFPAEAVYGPNHTPDTLANWDGRDEYEDIVQIASRDDDGNSYDYGDERAVEASVEVTRTTSMGMIGSQSMSMMTPRNEIVSPRSQGMPQSLWSLSASSDDSHDEIGEAPASPHIDTSLMEKEEHHDASRQRQQQQNALSPTSANSPSSANSLMMDLSDLEHSVNNEVSTVKDWMRKVKSERDRLRREKTLLNQQLAAERQGRDEERTQHQAELVTLKSKAEADHKSLVELKNAQAQVIEEKAAQDVAARSEIETVQTQLDSAQTKVAALEEALAKEKSTSTLREATKLEEVRKAHFEQLSKNIVELEEKFENDLKEMTAQKGSSLGEEQEAHAKTAEKLTVANREKERIAKELGARTQELAKLTEEHEQCAPLVRSTKEVITAVQAELEKRNQEYDAVKESFDAVNAEKQDLSSRLEAKSTQLTVLQKQLDETQASHLQEQDRMKEQTKKMCELVEVTSSDRDKAQSELKESQATLQQLTKSNDEAISEIAQLKEAASKRQVEIDTLNEARKCFESYEEESKAEIKRLQKKLEETTSDILRSCQSSDSSKDGSNAGSNEMLLAVPQLDGQTDTASQMVDTEKEHELQTLRDKLASVEKERNGLNNEIDQSKRERDRLRRMVDAHLAGAAQQLNGSDAAANIASMETEISDLKSQLNKAEEAFVKAEVEKWKKIGAITQERDELALQVKTFEARLEEEEDAAKENEKLSFELKTLSTRVEEEMEQLQEKLDAQVQENERLSSELVAMRGTNKLEDEKVKQLQDKLDSQVKENAQLSNELKLLKAAATSDVTIVDETKMDELQEKLNVQLMKNDVLLSELATVEQLQETLKIQVQANETLTSELTTLRSTTVSATEMDQLQDRLDALVKENEKLSSELSSLRAAKTAPDIESVAVQLGKEMEEMKQEHRIEVKLLKKEHATIKTKAKLLAKEKDELVNAYEVEHMSNNELEASLEEMLGLLQAERDIHGEKAKEFKNIRKKFTSMRKKRVPIDAAYAACRALLDKLEERRSNDGQEVTNAIKLIEGLTLTLDEQAGPESSLASISETFSSDNKQMEELASKCECLEIKCRAMKMKIASYSELNNELKQKIDQISEAPLRSLEDMGSQTSISSKDHDADLKSLRQANKSLKEKSKSLTKELVDSTQAFEETITSYETVIARVKNALSEKKQENEALKSDLDAAQGALAEVEASALKKHMEEIDVLKKKLVEEDAAARALDADNKKLKSLAEVKTSVLEKHMEEIDMLKKKLVEGDAAVSALESEKKELKSLAEEKTSALGKHMEEIGVLNKKLVEGGAAASVLEAEKKKLKSEVDRLKSDFEEVLSQFEEELTLSCEASEVVLQQKHDECEAAGAALRDKEEECSQLMTKIAAMESELKGLRSELGNHEADCRESEGLILQHERTVHKLQDECNQLASEKKELEQLLDRKYQTEIETLKNELEQTISGKQELEMCLDQMEVNKTGYQMEVDQLQSKLEGAMLSLEENNRFYEQLRADCASLKEDKEIAIEKNDELSAEIASLTQSYEQINKQLQDDCTKLVEEKAGATGEKGELTSKIASLTKTCEQLKVEKEVALSKSDELTATIGSLTSENEVIRTQTEQHKQAVSSIENQLDGIREEVRVAEEGRQRSAMAAEEAEKKWQMAVLEADAAQEELRKKLNDSVSCNEKLDGQVLSLREEVRVADAAKEELRKKLNDSVSCNEKLDGQVLSLREEVRVAVESRQKASMATNATEEELLRATTRLDDMLTYTEKQKVVHEETITSLKHELDGMRAYTEELKAGHDETKTSLKNELDKQMTSMNEVIQSLQSQIVKIESDKEENRRMYEKDISLQQAEVETFKLKHADALKNLDTLTDLVSNLKAALEGEKENAQILLSQFKKSEQDRKSHVQQKEELEAELASRMKSENISRERIRNLERVEKALTSKMKPLEAELQELRPTAQAREEELNELRASMMESENVHNAEFTDLKSKLDEEKRQLATMQERTKSLQQEFKRTLHKKDEEASSLRVVLQEAKGKLGRLWEENEELKNGNNDSMHSLQQMLNDAIRSRANTDASLQESLQLLEQQKRIDIKRKGEISKLEQTLEILKSKERYLESYVASLKKQIRRG